VAERRQAAMLVNVDPSPGAAVLEKLRAIPNLTTVQLVELGS
jgi:hypothetical protein